MPGARTLTRLATGLVATTYVLLVFGASVRVHGAGLACPDWPLCFGEVVPEIDFAVGHQLSDYRAQNVFLKKRPASRVLRGQLVCSSKNC